MDGNVNKCSVNCTSAVPLTKKDGIRCNGPCSILFHDVCSGLPRGTIQSRCIEIIRKLYICDECKAYYSMLDKRMNNLEEKFASEIDAISAKMDKIIGDSASRHRIISDELDDVGKGIQQINTGEPLSSKIVAKIGKSSSSAVAENFHSLKDLIMDFKTELDGIKSVLKMMNNNVKSNDVSDIKKYIDDTLSSKFDDFSSVISSLSVDLRNLTTKVGVSTTSDLNASFDTFEYVNASKNVTHSTSLHEELGQESDSSLMILNKTADPTPPSSSTHAGIPAKNCVAPGKSQRPHHTGAKAKSLQTNRPRNDRNRDVEIFETDADFKLVFDKKRKKLTKEVHFADINGKTDSNKSKSVSSRNLEKKPKYELIYVTKTCPDLNEGELSWYLRNELKIVDHSCHLVVPFNKRRCELKYLNFKVRVLSSDVDYLMRKDNWPPGVVVRKWMSGYERRKDGDIPPFKPNFYRQ